MNQRADVLVRSGFALALVILVAVGVLAYQSTNGLIDHESDVIHTYQVIGRLDELRVEMLEVESAARGYALSGAADLLEPYYDAIRSVGGTLDALKKLIADNPGQQRRFDSLQATVAEKLDFSQQKIETRKTKGFNAALSVFLTRRGHELMDNVRTAVEEMKAVEEGLLKQRSQEARADATRSLITLLALSTLSFSILFLVYYSLDRQVIRRRSSEERLTHLNRLYAVLTRVSELIVRVRERDELFRSVCKIAVEQGLFRMAWVGHADRGTGSIVPTAHWGAEDGYLDKIHVSAREDVPEGRGPTGIAVREGKPVVCSDIRSDPRVSPWRAEALKRGFASSAAFPLTVHGGVIGVFTVYAAEPGFFDDETVGLLAGVTSDLSFALESLEKEAKREKAEEEIRRLNEDLEQRIETRTQELAASNRELESRNREIERANSLKTEFLARMSHELRTPMNAIVGFSDLLAEQSEGPLNDTYQAFVRHIRTGARHLVALINDILDLSKIEAGRLELHCEEFRAAEPLAEVLSVIHPLAEVKGLKVSSQVPEDLSVSADRTRFKQILYNLLSNAVKFTPEQGSIWIASASDGAMLLFTVGDTGIGIPQSEQLAIFDEFHQAGVTTKGVKEGAGLGLAITKRLVELHGGAISVSSEPGRGSQFTFSLPAGVAGFEGSVGAIRAEEARRPVT